VEVEDVYAACAELREGPRKRRLELLWCVVTGFDWVAFRGECEAAFLPMCFTRKCLLSAVNVGARCVDFVVAYVCVLEGWILWVLGTWTDLAVESSQGTSYSLQSLLFVLPSFRPGFGVRKVAQRNEHCRHYWSEGHASQDHSVLWALGYKRHLCGVGELM